MRALVVDNGLPLGYHSEIYEAFDALVAEDVLAGYEVLPFNHHLATGRSAAEVADLIVEQARAGSFDLVIWEHTSTFPMPEAAIDAILTGPARPRMLYWEGDAYHPVHKPLPREALALMRRCHAVYMSQAGSIVRSLRRAGVTSLRYAPQHTSPTRFPHLWDASEQHDFRTVVVGNRMKSKVPLKTFPGARRRAWYVRALQRRYGDRFAVFGAGWRGDGAHGPIRYDEQSDVYRRAASSVGVENADVPLFFSDRLPIALATGVPLYYRRNRGFDAIFDSSMQHSFFSSPRELYALLDAPADEEAMQARSRSARRFFETNLATTVVARHIVQNALAPEGGAAPAARWMSIPPLIG